MNQSKIAFFSLKLQRRPMYIVYDTDDNLKQLQDKYVVLELDTIDIQGNIITAYAIINSLNINHSDQAHITEIKNLHANLLKNYRLQNWNFCDQAITHLMGNFGGELDSFYTEITNRIIDLKDVTIGPNWNGIINTGIPSSFE